MPARDSPSRSTRPLWALNTPHTMLIRVVLPAPFGPIHAVTCAGGICIVTLSNTCTPPKRIARPSRYRPLLVEVMLSDQTLAAKNHQADQQGPIQRLLDGAEKLAPPTDEPHR